MFESYDPCISIRSSCLVGISEYTSYVSSVRLLTHFHAVSRRRLVTPLLLLGSNSELSI